MTQTLADLLRGGGKFINWDDLGHGQPVTGVITNVAMRQARKYQTDEPDTWDDGTPKMQAVIEVATTERADPEDDGRRSVVVNLWSGQKKALIKACTDAGVPEPRVGDTFTVVWAGGAGGARDPRQFAYHLTPGSGLAATLNTPPPAATIPTPTAPARPAPPAPATPDPLAGFTPEQRAALAALAAQQIR